MALLSPGTAREIWLALPAALDGVKPLGLGFEPDAAATVPDGTAVVIATSGSTGLPKRVILSGEALRASAAATERRIGAGQWVLALPASYVAGLQVLVRSRLTGTEPVLLDGKFTPGAFVAATQQLHPDARHLTSLVPAQLSALLGASAGDAGVLHALRRYDTILVGGQFTSPALRERAAEAGLSIMRTYGSSETSGGCVYDGVPLDGVTVRAVENELRIAGPTLAEGYLADKALTAHAFVTDAEGTRWYRTCDRGTVDDGVVSVQGRIDDVIVSGGVNVSLDLVERTVRELPRFAEAVVVGVPDERWGEVPVVVVEGTPDAAAQLSRIREHLGATLGPAARPREIRVIDRLPRLPSGKPDRRAIARPLHD